MCSRNHSCVRLQSIFFNVEYNKLRSQICLSMHFEKRKLTQTNQNMNILLHSFLKTSCVVAKKLTCFQNTKLLRVGYRTPVPDFYLVPSLRKKHFSGLINQSTRINFKLMRLYTFIINLFGTHCSQINVTKQGGTD